MKVLFANTLYEPNVGGGAEVMLADMVHGLQQRGHDCTVLTTHGGRGVVREDVRGVPVVRIGHANVYWHFPPTARSPVARSAWHAIDGYNPAVAAEAGKAIEAIAPDVVVSHNLAGLSVGVWAQARKRGVPIVQVLHDYYLLCPKSTMFRGGERCTKRCGGCSMFRMPHRAASRHVDAVVGVSDAVLQTHLRNDLFERAGIRTVVHNARRMPAAAAEAGAASRPFTFGYIGALTELKGVQVLARAFERIAARDARPMQLLIAGSAKPQDEARLHREHASERIRFLGYANPAQFFAQIDVAVAPSLWNEPFPLVVLEAIASGVPVIGSRRGGIPEAIQHEVNGLLFEPSEPGALEAALLRMVDDEALRLAMRERGRASVQALLDPDRMLDQYEDVLRRVAGPGAAR